jgi:hypothetical protein
MPEQNNVPNFEHDDFMDIGEIHEIFDVEKCPYCEQVRCTCSEEERQEQIEAENLYKTLTDEEHEEMCRWIDSVNNWDG